MRSLLHRTLLAATFALVPVLAHAQQYFGQNRVQYRTFDFQVIQTEHFDVYYYPEERAAAFDAARMAERSYARLSRILDHRFTERKPIILYASHSDFSQTNATPGGVSEGIEGVTDAYKHRNVLPFPGNYADFQHVLTHEMTHQFQYDIWARGHAGNIGALVAINPPGWFVEGMAEYLSIGPVDPNTAMWIRDAALEGKLPTIEEMTYNPYIFPYRYGHALLAYIGERWGDEAVGALLKGTMSGGLEGSIRRTLGMNSEQLSQEWHDALQRRFLPAIADKEKARDFGSELLSKHKDGGVYNVAPALSPDGTQVAFFSERGGFTVDLWLADGTTGKVRRRLLKSTWSSNYETYRFINSSVSWSPDGRFLASAAKRGPKDDLIIIDVRKNRIARRIDVPLAGLLTPSFSPDGKQIVFSGLDGGLSDLFIVNSDGTGLRRLTNDKFADLNPVWSPDGKTIAFVTDRGPRTDFTTLTFGNLRIGLYDLASSTITTLDHMDHGENVSPQWSPDSRQIAFVSERTGVANIYLYDIAARTIAQLTDLYTGVQGITASSPVLSWAHDADRLAFVYYQQNEFDVYTVANPRSLARGLFVDTLTGPPLLASLNVTSPMRGDRVLASGTFHTLPAPQPADSTRRDSTGAATTPAAPPSTGGSFYRGQRGFRAADSVPTRDSTSPAPMTVQQILATDTIALPDTAEFSEHRYHVKFTPDYVAPPSLGYTRDNFGNGVYGGTTVVLSDLLGDRNLIFSGYVNGHITEASILAAYGVQRSRINYIVGIQQQPYFYLAPSQITVDSPGVGLNTYFENVRRIIYRSAFAQASYPFSRFRRIEAGIEATHLDDGIRQFTTVYDPVTGASGNTDSRVLDLPGASYVQPSLALTFDNTVYGYVGPFVGRRSRLGVSKAFGDYKLTQVTADYRRYDRLFGPFVFASRGLFIGRTGTDSRIAPIFLGSTDLLRGYTSGSFYRHECLTVSDPGTYTGCAKLDQLVGNSIGLVSGELRFPLLNASLGFLPIGFPPIEGAFFYDAGVAWNPNEVVTMNRKSGADIVRFREPLQTIGFSIRGNILGFLILRGDYSVPQHRNGIGGFWTISIGPTW